VNNQALWISVGLLVIELAAIVYVRHLQKKPIDPLRPRLIPLNFIFLTLVIAAFATMAHILSILTGVQVAPRRRRGL
jgi:hypothetical protein